LDTGTGHAATDPVCGMSVDPTGPHQAEHGGRTYHFCSEHCRTAFEAHPEHYTGGNHGDATESAVDGDVAEYTCPMHPEVRQPGPGTCPICGMGLEPVMVTADTGPSA